MAFNNLNESYNPIELEGGKMLYGRYKSNGGILTMRAYRAVITAEEQSSLSDFSTPTIVQTEKMAKTADITLDDTTIKIYGILRTRVKDIPGVMEAERGVINKLCDQRIFAETLLLRGYSKDSDEYKRFVQTHLYILAQ
ncbi:hypothetical protein JXA34_02070 [Patescibacteria group bacterium]|nr:hypothetical protein [Patescibacteria group bacterium]